MSLRKYLNIVAYIIAPTLEGQADLAKQLDNIPERETWGTSVTAQAGIEAFIG